MKFKFIFILLLICALTNGSTFAQQASEKRDSTHLYENIQTYSEGSKFRKFMYRLLFKPVATTPQKKKIGNNTNTKLIQKPYSAFEGKTIRNINIETLDPFGNSIGDTISVPDKFFQRTGNKLHIKSLKITIRNLLLIHPNQQFDSLLVKESERLVRSQQYIRDVSFLIKTTAKSSDSIDVFIRALDIWSIIPRFSTPVSHTTVGFTDRNFLGLGHEFRNDVTRNYKEGNYSYYTNYSIPNIKNTFIGTILHYETDGNKSFNKSLTIDRPFFSPFARWAAGISLTQQFLNDSVPYDDSHFGLLKFKFNSQDYWAGNAIPLFKGNMEYRTTNFISAVRFLRVRYLEKPNEMYDNEHRFIDENFYQASIGVSTRKYVQDKFIFKYGITEDVPVGKVFCLTGGIQEKNNTQRFYLGARASMGNYYPWGYLSSNIEYGTFFRAPHVDEGVFTTGVNYFTGLINVGKWKFRQFAKSQVSVGINRFASDSLTLNDGYGLAGFHTTALKGTSRLLFTLQTQAYAPWNFIGFRFGPYFIYSMGMLGDEISGFKNSKVYSQIGLGVLIKNENLVLNTFQISLSFYPIIPDKGKNIFKANSFSTSDFGFRDFEIGKPEPVAFR